MHTQNNEIKIKQNGKGKKYQQDHHHDPAVFNAMNATLFLHIIYQPQMKNENKFYRKEKKMLCWIFPECDVNDDAADGNYAVDLSFFELTWVAKTIAAA